MSQTLLTRQQILNCVMAATNIPEDLGYEVHHIAVGSNMATSVRVLLHEQRERSTPSMSVPDDHIFGYKFVENTLLPDDYVLAWPLRAE